MRQRIRILLLMDEVWNDALCGNNNSTNWFSEFADAEFAAICCSEGVPYNSCCRKYFQVTDRMMFKSLFSKRAAGTILDDRDYGKEADKNSAKAEENKIIEKISSTHFDLFRLARDILWLSGRYDIKALTDFIEDFSPDIVFSMRRATVKILRLERLIHKISALPVVAFTGDNELEEGVPMISPFAITRKLMIRHALKKTAPLYSKYYTSSEEQAETYAKNYGIETGLLFKCAKADREAVHKTSNNPIRLLYVGRLYCGRWKTLAAIGDVLKKANGKEVKAVLDIYSRDELTKEQEARLNDERSIVFKGAILPEKIKDEYKNSDVVLHVESFDMKNRAVTRHSYSTKVVDCLASGCAVMAIGWEKHSACIELRKSDSAIVVTDINKLEEAVKDLLENREKILEYAEKAMTNIEKEHSKDVIQNQLYNDFLEIVLKK